MWKPSLVAACLFGITASAQVALSTPPRLQSGSAPALPPPPAAIGGGQVFVELSIDPRGAVTNIAPLRTTPPFTEQVETAVGRWRFRPATATIFKDNGQREERNVASSVLVAALFRAPTLVTPTLGELPKDVASPSRDAPFPLSAVEPGYPPQAHANGVVMIEARIDDTGRVAEAVVIRSAQPFDTPSLEAARRWRFQPARPAGRAGAAYVYLIFGFPQPVIGTKRP